MTMAGNAFAINKAECRLMMAHPLPYEAAEEMLRGARAALRASTAPAQRDACLGSI